MKKNPGTVFGNAERLLREAFKNPATMYQVSEKYAHANPAILDADEKYRTRRIWGGMLLFKLAAEPTINAMAKEGKTSSLQLMQSPAFKTKALAQLKRIKQLALDNWEEAADGTFTKPVESVEDFFLIRQVSDILLNTHLYKLTRAVSGNPPIDHVSYITMEKEFGEVLEREKKARGR